MAALPPGDEGKRLAESPEHYIPDTDFIPDTDLIPDAGAENGYDGMVRLAAFICGTPIAGITLVDAERERLKAIFGLEVQDISRAAGFCAHAVLQSGVLVVPDAALDPRFADSPLVTGYPHIRFYAGAALVVPNGQALGSLFVVDRVPRHLTAEQESALQTLARQVTLCLQLEWETEQHRRSENALRQLQGAVTSAAEGITISDARRPDLPIIYANPAFYSLTGYEPQEVLEHNCRFLQGAGTDPGAKHQIKEAISSGRACKVTLLNFHKSGKGFWNELTIAPVRDAEGTLTHFIGVQHDITERIEREQQALEANQILEVQKAQLEAANAELAALATTDPLTGLLNHRAFHRRLEEETARAEREGTILAVGMVDLDNFKFFNDVYGHAVGDHVLRLTAERFRQVCRSCDTVARFGGDEFALLMPGIGRTSAAEVEARLRADLSGLAYQPEGGGTAIPLSASLGVALFRQGGLDRHEVLRQADERLLRAKTGGETETEAGRVRTTMAGHVQGFTMLDALVAAVDNKDRYTRKHSEDVMEYSLIIARAMGLEDDARRMICVAALLHDVGKIGVPDRILRKPDKLTDEEFEAIKQHPQMGAVMVGAVPGLEEVLDAVRHHHERWDGEGYPFGLRGEEIPLTARLMAVADSYSAMTTDRPYRKGMEAAKARSILAAGAGTQWDPECVKAFLSAHQDSRSALESIESKLKLAAPPRTC